MNLLDGRSLAKSILEETAVLAAQKSVTLAIIVATDDESAQWYVRSIAKKAEQVGIECKIIDLGSDATQVGIAGELVRIANDKNIHGIILQTPLPENVDIDSLLELIPVAKDIDGANPVSLGRLVSGLEAFAPATALAIMELLRSHQVDLKGKQAVVIGRSRVVGKPVAHLLLDQNATVTICHSRTKDLADVARQADVLVVAIGKAKFVTSDFVGKDSVVIDVGTNVDVAGNLVGDVDEQAFQDKDITLSPVPGGVGPVTTAILLRQTTLAATKA